jgi:hypothetical protein
MDPTDPDADPQHWYLVVRLQAGDICARLPANPANET